MSTEDFITELFCRIDDLLGAQPRRPDERISRSEVVTIGMLFALFPWQFRAVLGKNRSKGGSARAFYRWLVRDFFALFPTLPERTRLFRRMRKLWELASRFLAETTVFGIVDSYGVETIHPRRDGRTEEQIGRPGISNHRWIVGIKIALVVNQKGQIVAWTLMPANVHDQTFLPLIRAFEGERIGLGDLGFRCRAGIPSNLVLCRRGTWPERFLVETVFSLMTTVMHTKKMAQRSWTGIIVRVWYTMAMFNLLLEWDGLKPNSNGVTPLSIARFSL